MISKLKSDKRLSFWCNECNTCQLLAFSNELEKLEYTSTPNYGKLRHMLQELIHKDKMLEFQQKYDLPFQKLAYMSTEITLRSKRGIASACNSPKIEKPAQEYKWHQRGLSADLRVFIGDKSRNDNVYGQNQTVPTRMSRMCVTG